MKLTFLGANHEVTGSCTLLETGGLHFLIDCGMEQGKNVYENQPLPVAPGEIDGVLLTHAHIDHSGHLPLLAKQGYRGKIYATRPTCRLCDIMLRDSAHIQESEAEWKTRKNTRAGLPPRSSREPERFELLAAVAGVSRQRIYQVYQQAIRKLRHALHNHHELH